MSLAFSPGKTSLTWSGWLDLPLSKILLPPHPVTIGGVCVAWDDGAWMKRSRKTTRPVGNTIFAASFDRWRGPNLHDPTDQHAIFAQGGHGYPYRCLFPTYYSRMSKSGYLSDSSTSG